MTGVDPLPMMKWKPIVENIPNFRIARNKLPNSKKHTFSTKNTFQHTNLCYQFSCKSYVKYHGKWLCYHWKEGNVLFNDAHNTFYLRLYCVRHMVKDHTYSEGGNPLPPHRLLLPISSKGSFTCIPQTG